MTQADPHYSFRILSYDPLITLSGCQTDNVFLAQMAEDVPEVFAGRKGFHILLPTWNMEGPLAAQMKDSVLLASKRMPEHEFLVVANTEYEAYLLSRQGVPSLITNQSIFLDEDVWRPPERELNVLRAFDAVYNARLDHMKRHELARYIDKLLLVYGYSLDEKTEVAVERMRGLLPAAHFANAEKTKGEYSPLSSAEITTLYANTRVGLCLSREEGYSRVSVEYMLCGLPVVSTASIGGRDRYYSNEYCRVVDDSAEAVAHSVRELIARNYSPWEVREGALRLLRFDRVNFLKTVNQIVADHTGRLGFFDSIKPFMGIKKQFFPHSELLRKFKEDLARAADNTGGSNEAPSPAAPALQRLSAVGYASLNRDLAESLDAWKERNSTPKIFIRNDDAYDDSPALRNLVSLSEWLSVPVLLSTIPQQCERTLGRVVGSTRLITGAVHGYSHQNHGASERDPCELCSDRPLEVVVDELKTGREILLEIFDGRLSGLLVPPWNKIDDKITEAAMSLGFTGLSMHGWERMREAVPRINTHVDVIDWRCSAAITRQEIESGMAHQLDVARELGFQYIGIVTHHRVLSDEDWKTLTKIVGSLSMRGVEWVTADSLLPSGQGTAVG